MKNLKTIDITIGAVFVALMAIGANITLWLPFLAIPIGGATVPLSLQTFFAVLAGLMLGKRLGTLSMVAYLLIGIAGVPVFAKMKAGPFVLFDYTGGFLLSFVFVALITGLLAEKASKPRIMPYMLIALIGVAVNYIIGVSYMYVSMNTWLELNVTYVAAWMGMIPFLIKDIGVTLIAAMFIVKIATRLPNIPSLSSKKEYIS